MRFREEKKKRTALLMAEDEVRMRSRCFSFGLTKVLRRNWTTDTATAPGFDGVKLSGKKGD